MLMNQTIKSGDGVEYSMTKLCVCGGGGGGGGVVLGPIQFHKPNNVTCH